MDGETFIGKNRCNHSITAGGVVEAAEANVAIYVISILGIATIIGIFRGYNVEVETGKVSLRLKAGA